jgi:hypothetical protein
VASAKQFPPHLAQHVGHLLQQLVRLLQPAGGIGAAAGLAVAVLPGVDRGEEAGQLGLAQKKPPEPEGRAA